MGGSVGGLTAALVIYAPALDHATAEELTAAAERSTDFLRLSRGMLTLGQSDHLDWRTVDRVVQTGAREIEAQDGEERVEQRAEHLA